MIFQVRVVATRDTACGAGPGGLRKSDRRDRAAPGPEGRGAGGGSAGRLAPAQVSRVWGSCTANTTLLFLGSATRWSSGCEKMGQDEDVGTRGITARRALVRRVKVPTDGVKIATGKDIKDMLRKAGCAGRTEVCDCESTRAQEPGSLIGHARTILGVNNAAAGVVAIATEGQPGLRRPTT